MAEVIPTPLPLPAETEVRQNLLYWEDRYKRRCFEWHIEEVHPHLLKYMNLLTREDSSATDKSQLKFFLPLCGKSKDIPFLLDIGHEVFGVEAVESVIQEFIKENKLDLAYDADKLLYHSKDNKLKIYCGDLFKCPIEEFGPFDAVWDRASLIALDYQFRPSYLEMMKRSLKGSENFRYLLQSVKYDKSKYGGPPRSVDNEDIDELFRSWADVTCLESNWVSFDHPCRRVAGYYEEEFFEEFHFMKPKQN